ncbi:MAG: hypothetical protein ACK5QC_07940 [Bacteroidota bacterium]|jgi:hypothetical protein
MKESFSIPQRLKLLKTIVVLSLIISFCLSYRLWLSDRFFPTAPLINFDLTFKPDGILTLLSCLCLGLSLFFRFERVLLSISLLFNFLLILLDVNRLQAWFLMYNALLFILVLFNGRIDNPNRNTVIFICLQLLIISIYCCNALSNFNVFFGTDVLHPFLDKYQSSLSTRQMAFFTQVGKLLPLLIFLIGVALMFPIARYLAISLALIVHLCLFILLFPSSTNLNYAAWFVNIAFLFVLPLLFLGETKQRYFSWSVLFQKPLFYLCITLFFVFPILNVFNREANLVSINFVSYSESQKLSFDFNVNNNLPLFVRAFLNEENERAELKHKQWCLTELNSSLVNHPQVIIALNNYVQNQYFSTVKELQFNQ